MLDKRTKKKKTYTDEMTLYIIILYIYISLERQLYYTLTATRFGAIDMGVMYISDQETRNR